MKKVSIRLTAVVLAVFSLVTVGGCRKNPKSYSYYLSDDVVISGSKTSGGSTSDKDTTASGSKGNTAGGSTSGGKGSTANGKTTVKVAISSQRPTDTAPLFDALAKKYPNIKVQVDHYSAPNSQEYIATKSTSGQLPDIVFDDIANLPLFIGQGLVYPITSYVKADPEYKYIPSNIMKDYTYGGEVYALPHQAYFTCVTLNLDALDAMNVDVPALDWTPDDMTKFATATSNDKYSFCERLFYLDYYMAGAYQKNVGICGYNADTRSFEMTGSLAKAWTLFRKLRQTPNVEGWSLRLANKYVSRFGSDDEWAATKLGRTVMMDFEKGTYSKEYYETLLKNCKWTFHPYPQAIKGRMPIHIDHAFMLADTKVPDEAFKVLSFMTYSSEGNKARLNAYTDKAKGKSSYKLNLDYYTPVTTHPDVVSAAKKLFADDEVQLYMYNNISNCFRGDPDKIYPSFGQMWADVINVVSMKVQDGTKDPDSSAKDLEAKATKALKVYWDDFDKKLANVQKEWKAKHK